MYLSIIYWETQPWLFIMLVQVETAIFIYENISEIYFPCKIIWVPS